MTIKCVRCKKKVEITEPALAKAYRVASQMGASLTGRAFCKRCSKILHEQAEKRGLK